MTDYNAEHNFVVWCDIAVADLDRAIDFYSKVTGKKITKSTYGDMEFAIVEHDQGNGACLVVHPEQVSDKGPLIYLNVDGRIEEAAALVEQHGGKIVEPVTSIGEWGSRAVMIDSEGNRIALHSHR